MSINLYNDLHYLSNFSAIPDNEYIQSKEAQSNIEAPDRKSPDTLPTPLPPILKQADPENDAVNRTVPIDPLPEMLSATSPVSVSYPVPVPYPVPPFFMVPWIPVYLVDPYLFAPSYQPPPSHLVHPVSPEPKRIGNWRHRDIKILINATLGAKEIEEIDWNLVHQLIPARRIDQAQDKWVYLRELGIQTTDDFKKWRRLINKKRAEHRVNDPLPPDVVSNSAPLRKESGSIAPRPPASNPDDAGKVLIYP